MKVVLVGYGRMGRMVEEVLSDRGHTVHCRIDSAGSADRESLDAAALEGADGVIEFALAAGIISRLKIYAKSGLPAVVGTTGWDRLEEGARSLFAEGPAAILRGSNFSLGAHLFFRLTSTAAKMINAAAEYDVSITETHHSGKADYPSGTALTAANGVLAELDRKKRILEVLPEGPIPQDALQLASVRMGSVPGTHEMRIDSIADFLTIRHEARGRGGFALGAVRGLEWLNGRSGWFDADAFVDDLLNQ